MHNFKIILPTILAFLLATPSARSETSPIRVTISAPRAAMKVGSDVILNVTSTNSSASDLTVPYSHGPIVQELLYEIHISDNSGAMVRRKDFSDEMRRTGVLPPMDGHYGDVTLHPGDSVTDDVILNDIYDLSVPGHYAVYVSRRMSADGNIPPIKSNLTSVIIVP